MQRRRVAPDSLDYFPTPPFATRALCEFLQAEGYDLSRMTCWEPACGEMHMAKPLGEYFGQVRASDVHQYGDNELIDFALTGATEEGADFIISNPPFRLAEEFIRVGLDRANEGVAMLLRSAFLEGGGAIWQLVFCQSAITRAAIRRTRGDAGRAISPRWYRRSLCRKAWHESFKRDGLLLVGLDRCPPPRHAPALDSALSRAARKAGRLSRIRNRQQTGGHSLI